MFGIFCNLVAYLVCWWEFRNSIWLRRRSVDCCWAGKLIIIIILSGLAWLTALHISIGCGKLQIECTKQQQQQQSNYLSSLPRVESTFSPVGPTFCWTCCLIIGHETQCISPHRFSHTEHKMTCWISTKQKKHSSNAGVSSIIDLVCLFVCCCSYWSRQWKVNRLHR